MTASGQSLSTPGSSQRQPASQQPRSQSPPPKLNLQLPEETQSSQTLDSQAHGSQIVSPQRPGQASQSLDSEKQASQEQDSEKQASQDQESDMQASSTHDTPSQSRVEMDTEDTGKAGLEPEHEAGSSEMSEVIAKGTSQNITVAGRGGNAEHGQKLTSEESNDVGNVGNIGTSKVDHEEIQNEAGEGMETSSSNSAVKDSDMNTVCEDMMDSGDEELLAVIDNLHHSDNRVLKVNERMNNVQPNNIKEYTEDSDMTDISMKQNVEARQVQDVKDMMVGGDFKGEEGDKENMVLGKAVVDMTGDHVRTGGGEEELTEDQLMDTLDS